MHSQFLVAVVVLLGVGVCQARVKTHSWPGRGAKLDRVKRFARQHQPASSALAGREISDRLSLLSKKVELILSILLCPTGYFYVYDVQKCYKFIDEPEDWQTAKQKCSEEEGARLVSIKTEKEMRSLKALIDEHKKTASITWTSGYYDEDETSWEWGNEGQWFSFTDWASGHGMMSNLVTEEQKVILSKWLPNQHFKLLYTATHDGMSGASFHEKCDGKGPTISIGMEAIKRVVYGGYTSLSWAQTGYYRADDSAFIFKLGDTPGESSKFGVNTTSSSDAISDGANLGPTFGFGNDLTFYKRNTFSYNSTTKYFSANGYCNGPLTYTGDLGCGSFGDVIRWTDVEVYQVLDGPAPSGCVSLRSGDQKWISEDCNNKRSYICEL